jgi:hypothetical protein
MKHKGAFLIAVALAVAVIAISFPAGGKDPQMIQPPPEKVFTGMVQAVSQHQCEICGKVELSVTLKTKTERLEVKLGPRDFFEENDFFLLRGDTITVTGIRYNERGKEVVLANEVQKAGEHLILRGKYGYPTWISQGGHTCPVCGN